jgi:hypothetical protein
MNACLFYRLLQVWAMAAIGIHSAEAGDEVGRVVKDRGITFPVMADTAKSVPAGERPPPPQLTSRRPVIGETAKRYATDLLPNFFLIDKSGKLAWGFRLEPPTEEQLEELLR